MYVRDVARAELGTRKPDGIVRRFGAGNIAIRVTRDQNANVLETMAELREVARDIDLGVLRKMWLSLTQVYDETDYINSAIGLVRSNIVVGGLLTIGVLLLLMHH